ncbi:MAG: crotonase/enoyl-CoA hydratase family protein [Gammaproteobacteria bacterium]
MNLATVKTCVADGVMTVTLNRPEKLNAFTVTMFQDLMQVADRIDQDDEVRVAIFTGEGRAFCAGADLASGENTFNYDAGGGEIDWNRVRDIGGILNLRLFRSRKPLIAAINGPAVGVGATMTLPMDIRLAADNAKMGFVFVRRGIVPDGAASWLLPKVVGLPQALEWTLSGRVFDANEALNGGLVRSLHKPEDLMPTAMSLAREIADNTSAISVALARQLLWNTSGKDHPVYANMYESRGLYHAGRSPDAMEGVMSFLQKRAPKYPGKVSTDMPPGFPWWDEPEYR